MGNRGWVLVMVVAVLKPAAAAAAGSVVRLDARGGRVLVSVGLNGSGSYRFLLDTGATTTVLDSRLAARLGVDLTRSYPVHTFAGTVVLPAARIDRILVGDRSVAGVE